VFVRCFASLYVPGSQPGTEGVITDLDDVHVIYRYRVLVDNSPCDTFPTGVLDVDTPGAVGPSSAVLAVVPDLDILNVQYSAAPNYS